MTARGNRTARWLGLVLGCGLLGGCEVALDLVNPALLSALGIDTTSITGSPGVVLVAFNNTTSDPAIFYAFSAPNASNVLVGSRSFSTLIDGGDVGNEVVECPVQLLGPGQLDGSGIGTLAVTVVPADGTNTVDVNYTGGLLQEGVAFRCGDVIEIRLSRTAAGYAVGVRIIPGQ
ncbi:MAG: hypothetical protein IPM13_12570 [Phycisphaerales bacterium]|nr:hypothetical protein [Phycisphaerales bacterium]